MNYFYIDFFVTKCVKMKNNIILELLVLLL